MFCNNKNSLITNIASVIIQVIFIFSFLVIFYFVYVIRVESEEFKKQIELLTDSFFNDVKNTNIIEIVGQIGTTNITSEDLKVIYLGILDSVQEKLNLQNKKNILAIEENNKKLRANCINIIICLFVFLLIFLLILNCLPIYALAREAIIIVIFVAITEVAFLNFISGKYIAADPNRIKNTVGNSIEKWLQNNKKIKI